MRLPGITLTPMALSLQEKEEEMQQAATVRWRQDWSAVSISKQVLPGPELGKAWDRSPLSFLKESPRNTLTQILVSKNVRNF